MTTDFDELITRYDITIHAGADYQLDLAIVADDDTELDNYGVLIFDEILRDGSGSTMDIDNKIYELSDHWTISDETMIFSEEGLIIIGNWVLAAQLREYPEATDYYDFDVSVDTDGYKLTIAHDVTARIPYSHGVYDVFVTNADTGIVSKLISGDADIVRRVTK